MHRVFVAVDSALDIPMSLLEKYNIIQIPVHVSWQGRQYRDKLDLQLEELFEQGRGSNDFPTTSQPSPGEFADAYRKLAGRADTILSWHIASDLSGTWASASAAAKMVSGDIRVIDTKSVSMGGGLQALAAAKVIEQGGTADQAVEAGLAARDRVRILLVLDTLEYVIRGGRIGRFEAAIGSLLKIKPMLAVENGVIKSAGRTRSRRSSLDQLVNSVVSACSSQDGQGFVAAVGHACAEKEAEDVISRLQSLLPKAEIVAYKVGVAIGAHGGPGVLGVCFYNSID